jgi:sugar lactone lactonase YvrE
LKTKVYRFTAVAIGVAAITIAGTTPTLAATTETGISLRDPRILVHFDATAGETPEAIALEPDGSVDVSLARTSAAVRVRRRGHVELIGGVPRTGACYPIGIPIPVSAGIARDRDGTVFLASCNGNADSGIWRLRPKSAPVQIAHLPADSWPNGMTIDDRGHYLYLADTALGVVWRVPTAGGAPTVWASGPVLQPRPSYGANGIAIHHNAVWVSNTDQGIIVRIPIRLDGSAGPIRVAATGLPYADGFAVFGEDDTIIVALPLSNQVMLTRPGAQPRTVLTATDGLSYPSHVQVRRNTVYVSNFGDWTSERPNPNLLVAKLR